jgi:dienelactone hydrolase
MATFRHLGEYSDWVDAARARRELYPLAAPGEGTRDRAREVLSFGAADESPREVRAGERWERDGVAGEAVSWSVGYGPRTEGWVLKPAGANGPLPAIVALHDHGGFKFFGKEKIADGPTDPHPVMPAFRDHYYGGRGFANALAREGFVVLVHDTFLWGSRRFPLATMPDQIRNLVAASRSLWAPADPATGEIAEYNAAAGHHEHLVEKYCNLLGTTLAGVVAYEDRVAVNYLASRPDVLPDRIGCAGLSGGGNRAALLVATCDRIAAAAIVGLMSTYEHLLDHNVMSHTWMLFPNGWARHGDWPDLAASRAPMPLLVQYDLDDDLFTPEGMRAADARIATHYSATGAREAYRGEFYPGPHKFDLAMQESAFGWLAQQFVP